MATAPVATIVARFLKEELTSEQFDEINERLFRSICQVSNVKKCQTEEAIYNALAEHLTEKLGAKIIYRRQDVDKNTLQDLKIGRLPHLVIFKLVGKTPKAFIDDGFCCIDGCGKKQAGGSARRCPVHYKVFIKTDEGKRLSALNRKRLYADKKLDEALWCGLITPTPSIFIVKGSDIEALRYAQKTLKVGSYSFTWKEMLTSNVEAWRAVIDQYRNDPRNAYRVLYLASDRYIDQSVYKGIRDVVEVRWNNGVYLDVKVRGKWPSTK